MRITIYFTAFLVGVVLLIGCSGTKKLSKSEDFEVFSKKFYQDKNFHFKRILFPFEIVENTGTIDSDSTTESKPNIDKKVFTKNTLPQKIKSISEYPEYYKRKLDTTASGIDEQIFIPNSGYMEIRSFILEKRKWYLKQIMIMNL